MIFISHGRILNNAYRQVKNRDDSPSRLIVGFVFSTQLKGISIKPNGLMSIIDNSWKVLGQVDCESRGRKQG